LHVFLHVEENERAEIFPLESSGGVAAEFVRIVHSRMARLANLLAFLVFPVLPARETAHFKQFKKMAPEVGFEPTTNRLTADRSTTELRWIVFALD
jgi:hypothetical protein